MRTVTALFLFLCIAFLPAPVALAAMKVVQFDMLRKGKKIGVHQVSITTSSTRQTVSTIIRIDGKLGPVTLYKYRHKATEEWQNGRLASLESVTDDDGTDYKVSARRTGGKLMVTGNDGTVEAPSSVIPTSYWKSDIVRQKVLLDTQKGTLRKVSFKRLGKETVKDVYGGQSWEATQWRMEGDLRMSLWYTLQGEWTGLWFMHGGNAITYKRTAPTVLSAD